MIYGHQWGAPFITIVRVDGRPVHTAQQACFTCGTTRNALSRELVRILRSDWCRDATPPPQPDYKHHLRRIRQQLEALERDGYDVDREYTGRKPSTRPELPLAYKD